MCFTLSFFQDHKTKGGEDTDMPKTVKAHYEITPERMRRIHAAAKEAIISIKRHIRDPHEAFIVLSEMKDRLEAATGLKYHFVEKHESSPGAYEGTRQAEFDA
jgi:hypothetical protein